MRRDGYGTRIVREAGVRVSVTDVLPDVGPGRLEGDAVPVEVHIAVVGPMADEVASIGDECRTEFLGSAGTVAVDVDATAGDARRTRRAGLTPAVVAVPTAVVPTALGSTLGLALAVARGGTLQAADDRGLKVPASAGLERPSTTMASDVAAAPTSRPRRCGSGPSLNGALLTGLMK